MRVAETSGAKRRIQGTVAATRLEFQAVEILDMGCLLGAKERDDDGQADRDFGGGDGDDEEDEHLPVVVGQAVRRSD